MAQEPDLVISAGFSDAQLVREANKIVAMYAKKGEEAQKAFQDAQGRVTNTEAARAHVRELDKLSKSYDPAYRAAKQYEAEVAKLDRALDVGAVTQAQYTAKVADAARQMKAASGAAQQVSKGFSGQTTMQIQNAAFQIGDFAVQVASGTSASRALAQQMPQLLGGFGMLGAVLGAVVAVAVPLASSFLGAGDAAKELAKSVEDLEKAVSAYNAAAENSGATAAELASKFGAATAQAKDLYDRIARLQYLDAVSAVGTAIGALSKNFEDLQSYISVIDSEIAQLGSASPVTLENMAIQIKEQFGLTVDQAREFVALLSDAQAAKSIQEKAAKLNEIAIYLDNAVRSSGDANVQMRALAQSAAEGALKSYELAKSADQSKDAMQRASDAASTVAANVAGIDFSNAIAGAGQLVAALQAGMAAIAGLQGQQAMAIRRAEIARDFAGDKVGAAGALGELDFNAAYDSGNPYEGPLTREMQADLDARRKVYVEDSKDLARIQEQTQARMKAISAAGKPGNKGGGGRAKKEKEPVDIFESAGREIQQLERQIELLGKSNEQVAVAEARWAMLDAAKKAGIPVNDELNAKIDAQAAQVGALTTQLEQAELAQQQFDQAIEGIATAFSNAILQGESLRDSMANIFRQIAANILNAGIQQAIAAAFSGAGGGGFLGSLLSAAFGGTKAATPSFDGGGFTGLGSRSGGIDGKGGFPAILHPNETVLDHTKGQIRLRSGGSYAMTIDLRGTTGDRELDAKIARAGQAILSQVPATMQNHQRRRG